MASTDSSAFAFRVMLDILFRPIRKGGGGIYHSGKNVVEYGRGMCSIYSLRADNKSSGFADVWGGVEIFVMTFFVDELNEAEF